MWNYMEKQLKWIVTRITVQEMRMIENSPNEANGSRWERNNSDAQ